jgi:hypothetical protein
VKEKGYVETRKGETMCECGCNIEYKWTKKLCLSCWVRIQWEEIKEEQYE